MNRLGKSLRRLREPTYRTKLAFFVLLGAMSIALSVLIRTEPWSTILFEFSITFIAVTLIQVVWDFLGGDPLEESINQIQLGSHVIADLVQGRIGLQRIWPDRRTWQDDPEDGLAAWKQRTLNAMHADILSNTLWNNWFTDEKWVQALFDSAQRGAHVRILVYKPGSPSQLIREGDEPPSFGKMQNEIRLTIRRFLDKCQEFEVPPLQAGAQGSGRRRFRGSIELRLTEHVVHLAQIIRCDDQVLISPYLSGETGGPSPAFQAEGTESAYHQTYSRQFDKLWNRAAQLTEPLVDEVLNPA